MKKGLYSKVVRCIFFESNIPVWQFWQFDQQLFNICLSHPDDVIEWKHFPRYWPFVRRIHLSQVDSPHKDQWRGALMFLSVPKRLRKQSWHRWFETPSRSLWRHCNDSCWPLHCLSDINILYCCHVLLILTLRFDLLPLSTLLVLAQFSYIDSYGQRIAVSQTNAILENADCLTAVSTWN